MPVAEDIKGAVTSGMELATLRVYDPRIAMEWCDRHNVPADFAGMANQYTCPLGPRPGVAYVLMIYKDVKKLHEAQKEPDVDAKDEWKRPTLTLRISDSKDILEIKGLVYHSAKCVAPSWRGDPDCLYLVKLYDRRFIANRYQFRAGSVDGICNAFNVRNPSQFPEYFWQTLKDTEVPDPDGSGNFPTIHKPYSFTELLQLLWETNTGGSGAGYSYNFFDDPWPGLPDGVDDPSDNDDPKKKTYPDNTRVYGKGILDAIEGVARRIGMTIRFDPFEDVIDLVRPGDDDDDYVAAIDKYDSNRELDWVTLESRLSHVCEFVRVMFPAWTEAMDLKSQTLQPVYYIDVALSALGLTLEEYGLKANKLATGTYHVITDNCAATLRKAVNSQDGSHIGEPIDGLDDAVPGQSIDKYYAFNYLSQRAKDLAIDYVRTVTGGKTREFDRWSDNARAQHRQFWGYIKAFQPGAKIDETTYGDIGDGSYTMFRTSSGPLEPVDESWSPSGGGAQPPESKWGLHGFLDSAVDAGSFVKVRLPGYTYEQLGLPVIVSGASVGDEAKVWAYSRHVVADQDSYAMVLLVWNSEFEQPPPVNALQEFGGYYVLIYAGCRSDAQGDPLPMTPPPTTPPE